MNKRVDAEIIKELRNKVKELRIENKDLSNKITHDAAVNTRLLRRCDDDIRNWESRYNKLSESHYKIERELEGAEGVTYELKERFNFMLNALITPIIYNQYTPPPHVREFLLQHTQFTIDTEFLELDEEYREVDVKGLLE